MVIRSNVYATNAYRNLNKKQIGLGKALEKLSSGYRINRSADDASGLCVSEKMRAMIRGYSQAVRNSQDAVSLIETAEGALQEVHSILDRMGKLAEESANGIYDDAVDRSALQLEFQQLQDEIDFISEHTDFNGMMLFDGAGGINLEELGTIRNTNSTSNSYIAVSGLERLLSENSGEINNIIYTKTVYDFQTTQTNTGTANSFNAAYQYIADTLQTSIVPQVVKSITDTYTAFNYLSGSSIGIGLNLYSDPGSSTLASVYLGTSYTTDASGNLTGSFLEYSLKVNVASVDLGTSAGRSALEQTIAHEMIHAFMDEATTAGMTGITPSGKKPSEKFPKWFIEGMAQTASGPGNWTRGITMGLTDTSSASEISAALNAYPLTSNSDSSHYGTGYLACMYLGYLESGGSVDMDNSTEAATQIAMGVSSILSKIISGQSLDSAISEATGGMYSTAASFASGFANDANAISFVQKLLKYTSNEPYNDGNVGGGLIGGDLADSDPVPDSNISGLNLFALDTTNTAIKNQYPPEITILSGGTTSASGVPPISSVTPPPVVYPSGLFTVVGGTEGIDWEFDTATGTLNILTGTAMEISGGTLTDASGTYYGNIVIADGTSANITLSGVDIDASKRTGNDAGILIGKNGTSTINIKGDNTILGGGKSAGIQLSDNDASDGSSTVIINSESGSNLTVKGGTYGAGIGAAKWTNASASNIEIRGSGVIDSVGGEGAAGIGGADMSRFGNISIDGSDITIKSVAGKHGAGIGGGWTANVGDITILGKANIEASGITHGTGIGGGCQGNVGTITIGTAGSTADDDIVITAKGGDDGAAIGSSWNGKAGAINLNGGTINANAGQNGAGIGSGLTGSSGVITVNGGIITANGSTDASGIGGGKGGVISGIVINGGEITAKGGWTHDGGNIGGFIDKSGTTKTGVIITDPNGLSIKAGSGEGKYITTGTKDAGGNDLYAFDVSYLDELLGNGEITLSDNGADPLSLSYPIDVNVVGKDGTAYSWADLKHSSEMSGYIWMKAQDIKLTFTDADGTTGTVDLTFFEDYGMWRINQEDLPPVPPEEPEYHTPINPPVNPPVDSPEVPPIVPPDSQNEANIWIMQTGPRSKDTFYMDIGIMNTKILGIDVDTINVSTQLEANKAIDIIGIAKGKVSSQRAKLGAYQNRLEHKIDNLNVSLENTQSAESLIRDTNIAECIMQSAKEQILSNAAQSMLAQANNIPKGVLSLLS